MLKYFLVSSFIALLSMNVSQTACAQAPVQAEIAPVTFMDPQSGQVTVTQTVVPDTDANGAPVGTTHTVHTFRGADGTQFDVSEIGGQFYFVPLQGGTPQALQFQGPLPQGEALLQQIYTLGRALVGH